VDVNLVIIIEVVKMSLEYIRKVLMAKEPVMEVPVQLTIAEFYLDEEWDTMTPRFVNWNDGCAGHKIRPMQFR